MKEDIMARRKSTDVVDETPDTEFDFTDTTSEDLDVDVPAETDDEVEEVAEAATADTPKKAAAKPKEKSRGDLPEGYVTPVGLAKLLTEQGLGGQNEDGSNKEVKPQVVYSYIKNAPAAHPFPLETVTDSLGKERQALVADKGLDWWRAKNERAAARKANAAEKASKKGTKTDAAPATEEPVGEVTEAE
jgi:hypothetical protein